jgi:hypothetical protein
MLGLVTDKSLFHTVEVGWERRRPLKKISGFLAANISHKNEITLDRASQHNQGLFLFDLDI